MYCNWKGLTGAVQYKDIFTVPVQSRVEILVPVPDSSPAMNCAYKVYHDGTERRAHGEIPDRHGNCITDLLIKERGIWKVVITLSYDIRRRANKTIEIYAGKTN